MRDRCGESAYAGIVGAAHCAHPQCNIEVVKRFGDDFPSSDELGNECERDYGIVDAIERLRKLFGDNQRGVARIERTDIDAFAGRDVPAPPRQYDTVAPPMPRRRLTFSGVV